MQIELRTEPKPPEIGLSTKKPNHLAGGTDLPAVWPSRDRKPGYYWTPKRGTFRSKLEFIKVGDASITRQAKKFAKYVVLEKNDFGTARIGFLLPSRSGKPLRQKQEERKARGLERLREQQLQEESRRQQKARDLEVAARSVGILPALLGLNRAAKRHRDAASSYWSAGDRGEAYLHSQKKKRYYELKGSALHWLVADGTLTNAGYHAFPNGNVAEVLQGDGYRFHRPAPRPEGVEIESIDEIQGRPQGDDVDETVAEAAVKLFIGERGPVSGIYEWPPRDRPSYHNKYDHISFSDDEDDFDQHD